MTPSHARERVVVHRVDAMTHSVDIVDAAHGVARDGARGGVARRAAARVARASAARRARRRRGGAPRDARRVRRRRRRRDARASRATRSISDRRSGAGEGRARGDAAAGTRGRARRARDAGVPRGLERLRATARRASTDRCLRRRCFSSRRSCSERETRFEEFLTFERRASRGRGAAGDVSRIAHRVRGAAHDGEQTRGDASEFRQGAGTRGAGELRAGDRGKDEGVCGKTAMGRRRASGRGRVRGFALDLLFELFLGHVPEASTKTR